LTAAAATTPRAHLDRSRARAWALQVLYRWESDPEEVTLRQAFERTLATRRVAPRRLPYLERLIQGLERHGATVDDALDDALANWRLERLATLDRAILRLGGLELLFFEDVPPKVAIQEAVRLAERYGGSESPRFVNGVLDALYKRLRAAGDATAGP